MARFRNILAGLLLAALAAAPALAADDGSPLRKPPSGSVAAQLRLKFLLKAQAEGSLLAAINHSRQDWENLSPDERDQYRRNVLAFLNKSPEDQEKLLQHYDELVRLSAEKKAQYTRRAAWLKAVVERMTPEERKALLNMTPEDRARALVEKRDQLRRQGVILESASSPATAPAS